MPRRDPRLLAVAVAAALVGGAGLTSRAWVSRDPAPSEEPRNDGAQAVAPSTAPVADPPVASAPTDEVRDPAEEDAPPEYACLAAVRRARGLELLLDLIEADPVAATPVLADAVRDGAEAFLADTRRGATGRYADGCLEADDPVRAAIERLRAVADERRAAGRPSAAVEDMVADLEAIEADAAP